MKKLLFFVDPKGKTEEQITQEIATNLGQIESSYSEDPSLPDDELEENMALNALKELSNESNPKQNGDRKY